MCHLLASLPNLTDILGKLSGFVNLGRRVSFRNRKISWRVVFADDRVLQASEKRLTFIIAVGVSP